MRVVRDILPPFVYRNGLRVVRRLRRKTVMHQRLDWIDMPRASVSYWSSSAMQAGAF
jgi:hypothetical protein